MNPPSVVVTLFAGSVATISPSPVPFDAVDETTTSKVVLSSGATCVIEVTETPEAVEDEMFISAGINVAGSIAAPNTTVYTAVVFEGSLLPAFCSTVTVKLSSLLKLAVALAVAMTPTEGLEIVATIDSAVSMSASSVVANVITAVLEPLAILNVLAPVA